MSGACHGHPGHGHAHGRLSHGTSAASDRAVHNIKIAFILNLLFAIVELIGGWWTGSVAIQADAIHDFGDSLVLLSAFTLQSWSAAQARGRFTFGFRRLSLLSALGASLVIFLGSIFIVASSIDRLTDPQMPHLTGMFWLALLGVCVNGYAAWRIGRGHTQNERALSWHMIEDLLGWLAVLVGSIVMRFYDWPWLDPVMSLVIAGFIILGASRNIWASSQLFLQAAPLLNFDEIKDRLIKLDAVSGVKSLRVWSLDGVHHVASLHLEISSNTDTNLRTEIKNKAQQIFSEVGEFDLTIELHEGQLT